MKSPSGSERIKWAFRLVPKHGELLSGYVCRIAAAHGMSPHGFCAFYLDDSSFWTRDVDRGAVTRHYDFIAAQADISVESLRGTTLDRWRAALVHPRTRLDEVAAVTPWINAVGVLHRMRRQHALQFCPLCLAEEGIIKKAWRLSFFVTCDLHRVRLSDACPRCDAPFMPHRSRGRIFRCHACQHPFIASLDQNSGKPALDCLKRVAVFQAALHQELQCCENEGNAAGASDRLLGIRDLIAVISSMRTAAKTAALLDVDTYGCFEGIGRLEFARIGKRIALLKVAEALMTGWPGSFRRLSAEVGLTQMTFARLQPIPSWVQKEVDALPPGVHRARRTAAKRIEMRVADIDARRPENWRAKRAGVLLRAARRLH